MNSENLKEIQKKLSDEKWMKDCLLIKTEEGTPDLLVFLLNANWEKNEEWICFVILNIGNIKEEIKIKLLDLFFLMRRREYFDYSDEVSEKLLKEKHPKDFRDWKKLEEGTKKEWKNFVSTQENIYQPWMCEKRKTKFHLLFSKFKAKKTKKSKASKEQEANWQEWEALSKASFAYNFNLLGKVICGLVGNFSEEGKIKRILDSEEMELNIEFDIDAENVPDILITSGKIDKKIWIEMVEVYSCLTEIKEGNRQPFTIFIQDQLNKKIKESIEKHGEEKLEAITNSIEMKEVVNIEKKDKEFIVSWKFPKEINNVNYLMKNLKETVEEKNKKRKNKRKTNIHNFENWFLKTFSSRQFFRGGCP